VRRGEDRVEGRENRSVLRDRRRGSCTDKQAADDNMGIENNIQTTDEIQGRKKAMAAGER
jgi:hypothetical protein